MISRRTIVRLAAASALTPCFSEPCARAGDRLAEPLRAPDRALAPGGPTDVAARLVAEPLSKMWGQQVVIENKPGGGTNIAAELVAKSDPDGYTILYATSSLAVAPQSLPNARLRSGRRFCAGFAPLQFPVLHVRAEYLAGKDGAGIHRLCQEPIPAS